MHTLKRLLFLLVILSVSIPMEAQLLKRVLRESTRKAEKQIGDMAVRKLSDAIARKATQSVEGAFDKMIRDAMENDSTYRNDGSVPDSTYYRAGQKYGEFMRGMYASVELPEKYEFDISMLVETSHGKEEPKEMWMHFAKGKGQIAIEQMEGKTHSIMFLDMNRDVVVMYTEDKKGKKTYKALSGMMNTFGGMAARNTNDEDFSLAEFKATGKTKTIAGYKANEYVGESKSETVEVYFSTEVPIDWNDTFGGMVRKMAPTMYRDGMSMAEGVALESITTEKKKPKTEYFYTTKKVVEQPFVIDNSEYESESWN